MSVFSIPAIVSASISIYAGVYQLLLYLRRPRNRVDLTFSLMCFAGGFYAFSSAGLYSAHSVAEGIRWLYFQMIGNTLLGVSFMWFLSDYTGMVSRRAQIYFSAFYAVSFIINLFVRNDLTRLVNQPFIKHVALPFGLSLTYYEARPGILVEIQGFVGLFLGIYAVLCGLRLVRNEQAGKAKWLFVALILFFLGALNDAAVTNGFYSSVYLVEYAYLGMVLLMGYSLSEEVLQADKVKQALLESEIKSRNIVQALPLGMHMYRHEGDDRLVFTGANPAADTILGIPNDQFINKTIEEAFPIMVDTEMPERFRQAATMGQPWNVEHVTYDGLQIQRAFDIHAFQTAPGMMAATFLDITNRKQAEEALRRERDLMSRFMLTSPSGITVLDRSGNITFANSQAEHVLGLGRDEISGRSYNAPEWKITAYDGGLFPDEELPFVRVMSTGLPVFGVRHAIQWPDGKRVLLSINAAPLFDDGNNPSGMVATVEDITTQVHAEEAVRLSEERYRAISELTSDLAYSLRLEGDENIVIEWAVGPFSQITGYTEEEIGQLESWRKLIHPDDQAALIARVNDMQASQADMGELRIVTKFGEVRWLNLFGSVKALPGGSLRIIGAAQDVTERKLTAAEQAARSQRSEWQQAALVDLAVHDAIINGDFERAAWAFNEAAAQAIGIERASIWLFSSDDQELRCVDLFESSLSTHSTGYVLKAVDYPSYFATIHSGRDISACDACQDERLIELLDSYLAPNDIVSLLNSAIRVRGQIVGVFCLEETTTPRTWMEDEIAFAGKVADQVVLAILNEERKQAAQAQQQYTERLKILRTIDRAILAVQSSEQIAEAALSDIQRLVPCVYANVSIYDPDTHSLNLLASYPTPERADASGFQFNLSALEIKAWLSGGEWILSGDLLKPPGWLLNVQELVGRGVRFVKAIPLFAIGELIGVLLIGAEQVDAFTDERMEVIGELADVLSVAMQQAHLHEKVRHQNEELEERVRQRTAELEAKNRELETFTYSVSHDLKAPLRGLDGYSRLLLQDHGDRLDEEGRTFLQTIRRATEQMAQLINDLLAYSRLERRSIVVEQVYLPDVVNSVLEEHKEEIQSRNIDLIIDLTCRYAWAEKEGLAQAVRNLLDNALKFTRNTEPPHIEIGSQKTERGCILWLKDNGIGFDMQYNERIFEIFQRLHRVEDYPGTGIGLALVRKVMQRMGGRVWAESTPGAGATFYLELPE
jgi:PAS domain S-box-containing protein